MVTSDYPTTFVEWPDDDYWKITKEDGDWMTVAGKEKAEGIKETWNSLLSGSTISRADQPDDAAFGEGCKDGFLKRSDWKGSDWSRYDE